VRSKCAVPLKDKHLFCACIEFDSVIDKCHLSRQDTPS
jgi:hypothetical protein